MKPLSPAARRVALVLHVLVSVGFPGAVACFLALALIGLTWGATAASGIYWAMEAITRLVIVPLCLASLLSGLVSAIWSPWGLLRYWWVVVKLVMTVLSTAILLIHLGPIDAAAHITGTMHPAGTQFQLAAAASAAIVALIFMAVISIYKPRGLTRNAARQLAP